MQTSSPVTATAKGEEPELAEVRPCIPTAAPESATHDNLSQQELTFSPHTPGFEEIRSLDLSDDRVFRQLIDTIRLEPFLRGLPATREEDPALYEELRDYFQELIKEGSVTLYDAGVNIHEAKKFQMQIVLGGNLQMNHNRYSRQVEELKEVGFEGPRFERGMALASWSMAGVTKSHFGEISAVGPAIALAISGEQYERLVLLTMKHPGFATALGTIPEDEVRTLLSVGVLKNYSEGSGELCVIERARDMQKRPVEDLKKVEETWRRCNLERGDFVICENGSWRIYQHSIQSAIKQSTVTQHVLQKNFLYNEDERKSIEGSAIAPAFRQVSTNDEFLALARNTREVSSSEPISSDRLEDELFLATFDTPDVEKPSKPLKFSQHALPGVVELAVALPGAAAERRFSVALHSDGVIDPKELLADLVASENLPADSRLASLRFRGCDGLKIYSVDVADYRRELSGSTNYSSERVINDLINLNYQMSPEIQERLSQLFEHTASELVHGEANHTELSMSSRRELLSLMYNWVERDALGRRGPEPVVFDGKKLGEVATLFEIYRESRGSPADLERLLNEELTKPKADLVRQKVLLLAAQFLDPQGLQVLLVPDVINKLYYRDVKHLFGAGADEAINRLSTNGFSLTPELAPETPWARHEGRDVVVIPDRHEDLWGMHHELKAMGVMDPRGGIHIEKLSGKRLIFIGDVLNRSVDTLGAGTLHLVDRLMEEARQYNRMNPGDPRQSIEIQMCIGNHELDLLRLSDADVDREFSSLSENLIARHCRGKIREMIQEGKIVASIYLGNRENPAEIDQHAIASHAGMLPDFKRTMREELRGMDQRDDDLALVNHLNQVLVDASSSGDFSHALFAKSANRGGKQSFSGSIEADMGGSSKSDLTIQLQKMRESGLGEGELADAARSAFGYQIVGHSFRSDNADCRIFASGDVSIPGCLITDNGDHQAFDPNPSGRIRSIVILPEQREAGLAPTGAEMHAQTFTFRPTFGDPIPLPPDEETAYRMHKNPDHPLRSIIREAIRNRREHFSAWL